MSDLSTTLPGHDLVSSGLGDLAAGQESEASLLVAMAAPRLRAIGINVPQDIGELEASHRLYDLLTEQGDDAYGRYNALLRRIVSFARAAEHASSR